MRDGPWSWLYSLGLSVGGYAGIFIVSVIGNVIPFIPIPYLAVVFFYSALIPYSNPLLIGLVSGLGGGVGKLIIYVMSMGASKLLPQEKVRRLEALKRLLGNYGALAVFLFAVTPSPDDIVIALLGMMHYSVVKFFAAVTLGKVVISLATAYFGRALGFLILDRMSVYAVVVSIVIFLILTWLILTIDWEEVAEIVGREGWRGLLKIVKKCE